MSRDRAAIRRDTAPTAARRARATRWFPQEGERRQPFPDPDTLPMSERSALDLPGEDRPIYDPGAGQDRPIWPPPPPEEPPEQPPPPPPQNS
jgi:hypothetical protein